MNRAPFVIAALPVPTAVVWILSLVDSGSPFAADSGLVLGGGLLMFAVIVAAGILLARGRWSRRVGLGLTAAMLSIGAVVPIGALSVMGLALTGLCLAGFAGPWLARWLRRRPAADGPGLEVMVLAFGALSLLPAVGVASPAGLSTAHGVLAGCGLAFGWAFTRARLWGLWALRVVLAPVTVWAAVESPPAGAALLLLIGFSVVTLSWRRQAARAVMPLMSTLPGPRYGRAASPSATKGVAE